MNFVLKPSLKQRALVKVAVFLWNQNDVRASISLVYNNDSVYLSPLNEKWKEVEASVLERVAQLPLPQSLKEKLSCFVQTIGLEIYEWIKLDCMRYDLPLRLPIELCWTAQGTVDRKRTAEALVKGESLDIATRYRLACIYCLEDDIVALWNTLSEDLRQSNRYRYAPIEFWSRTMKGRGLDDAPTSYKYQFLECASRGNKAAAEYFLQKLTPREREASLVEAAKYVEDADTLCFLLSELKEEQQMEVFRMNPLRVLDCFLQWPWQNFFIEIANCMWDFISKKDYENTLRRIINKVRYDCKDWNYPKLFREFWQKSPGVLKSSITNELDESDILPSLCRIKDKEIIRLILQDATPTAREKLIYSEIMHIFCQCSIRDDKWDSLEFCIRECFPSRDLMLKFKEAFEKREKWMRVEDKLVRNKDRWDKLFLSLDDSFREYEKRSADEGESSSSKKFRSLQ